jgi:hypothetical protein
VKASLPHKPVDENGFKILAAGEISQMASTNKTGPS